LTCFSFHFTKVYLCPMYISLGSQSLCGLGGATYVSEKPQHECQSKPTYSPLPLQVGERVPGSCAPVPDYNLYKITILPLKCEHFKGIIWVFCTTLTLFSLLISILSLCTPFLTLNPFIHHMFSGFLFYFLSYVFLFVTMESTNT